MTLLSPEKIIEYLPCLFETNLKGQVDIFKKLEKILIFDEGFIYFANPDSLQLKYSYKKATPPTATPIMISANSVFEAFKE